MSERFYLCKHCGNLVGVIHDGGVPLVCCGEKMVGLVPNTTEAAGEKHLPKVCVEGKQVVVNVGEVQHPMSEEHFIQWVYLKTEKGGQRKNFVPGDLPTVEFSLVDDKPVAVYAYCNLHGLWMTEL